MGVMGDDVVCSDLRISSQDCVITYKDTKSVTWLKTLRTKPDMLVTEDHIGVVRFFEISIVVWIFKPLTWSLGRVVEATDKYECLESEYCRWFLFMECFVTYEVWFQIKFWDVRMCKPLFRIDDNINPYNKTPMHLDKDERILFSGHFCVCWTSFTKRF